VAGGATTNPTASISSSGTPPVVSRTDFTE
jgi:hypothetical protein